MYASVAVCVVMFVCDDDSKKLRLHLDKCTTNKLNYTQFLSHWFKLRVDHQIYSYSSRSSLPHNSNQYRIRSLVTAAYLLKLRPPLLLTFEFIIYSFSFYY